MATRIKIAKLELNNCVDCPFISYTPIDPAKWDEESVAICSNPDTIRARGIAITFRQLGSSLIPEWCPLEDK